MLNRIFFTLSQSLKYYSAIHQLKQYSVNTIANIARRQLVEKNIKILALDFDGVLASHGEDVPNKIAEDFLNKIYVPFQNKIFILSNKPTEIRKQYFEKNYPEITFIKAVKKKPYPDGLNKIIELTGARPEEVVLVDDRLLTGGLAAILANTQIIYIRKPFINFSKRPVLEFIFQCLRVAERLIF